MTSARLGAGRLAAWVAIAIAVPYLLLLGGTLTFLAWPGGRIALQALMLGAAVAGLALAHLRPWLLRSPVVVAGAAFVVAGIASAIVSQRPEASVEAAALLVLSAPCYLAIRAVAWDEPLRSRVRWLIVVCAFLVLVPYIVQVLALWWGWLAAIGLSVPPLRPALAGGTVGNPNAIAVYAYLLVPYALWCCWSWRRRRAVAGLLAACATFVLVTSGSRGAWIGAAAGVTLWAVLVVADRQDLLRAISRRRLLVVGGLGLVALAILSPYLLGRFAAGDAARLELWSAAVAIFQQFPLLGGGPGSWQGLRPLLPIADPDTAALLSPHDSVLYVAAEMGVTGLATAALLVGAIGLVAWRAYRRGGSGRRVEVAVVVGSLVAAGLHSLVDTQFHLAAVVLMAAYLVARLDEPAPSDSSQMHRSQRVALAVTAVAVAVATVTLVRIDGSMIDGQDGDARVDAGDWSGALVALDQATALHDLGVYELGRAIALSHRGETAAAAEALRRQAAIDPFTSAQAGLAILLESSDPAASLAAANAVRDAGPYDPTATLNAAGVLDRRGDDRAVDMVADVLVSVPFLRLDPLPDGPVAQETWRAAVDLAISRLFASDPLAAANLALEAGDNARALELSAGAPPGPARSMFERYVAARAGTTPDLNAARDEVLEAPPGFPYVWYARLATMADSGSDRERARVLSEYLLGGGPFGSTSVRTDDATTGQPVVRLPTYPSAVSYRPGPQRPYVKGTTTLVTEDWRP